MPNECIKKTNRSFVSQKMYEMAYQEIKSKRTSIRVAASSYNFNHVSLFQFVKKKKAFVANLIDNPPSIGYVKQMIFTEEGENISYQYILTCAAANYGLKTKETRKLAFRLVKEHNKKFPKSWEENEMTGEVWFQLFMKRHPNLSLKLPQPTSIARATSFNKTNVNLFFLQRKLY